MTEGKAQRLRMTFAKGEAIKYISHLDLVRVLERAFRRAELPLVYSQGFSPHPRFALGAALPVGLTSVAEVLDVWLSLPLSPEIFTQRLSPQLPTGLHIIQVREVDLALPSLQSCMRWAEYRVILCPGQEKADVERRIARFLAAESLPRLRRQKDKMRAYNLRPLVVWLALAEGDRLQLDIRLAASSVATGRVDEVLAELGLQEAVCGIERTQLIWEEHIP